MEDFLTKIQAEVKNDPLSTLNLVMAVFTLLSFTRLISDLCSTLFCKTNDKRLQHILERVESLSMSNDLVAIQQELVNLRLAVERVDSYLTQVHEVVCIQQSKEVESVSEEEASQTTTQEELQPLPVTIDHQTQDKHSQLMKVLKDGDVVSMTYKKQTFSATFVLKTDSLHGYILKGDNNTDYNTPSHFSHSKKVTINNKIRSDNGWETVYVIRDSNKLTLNELIATA